MKIKKQSGPPEDLIYFDDDLPLSQSQVEDVVEIFKTPLTGSYNWDYTVADNRIKKLYELGKELNWNGSIDLNWDYTHPANERILETDDESPHETLTAYENLSDEEKKFCGMIYSCIKNLAVSLKITPLEVLKTEAKDFLQNAGFEIDYLEIVDANNLSSVTKNTDKVLIAVAVIYKKVRLIDNVIVSL